MLKQYNNKVKKTHKKVKKTNNKVKKTNNKVKNNKKINFNRELKKLKLICKEDVEFFGKEERKEYLEFALKNASKYLKKYRKLNYEGEYLHSLTEIASIIAEDYTFRDM